MTMFKDSLILLFSWLQPDRAVNLKASELILPVESLATGVPSVFTVNTKDQEGKLVHVEDMKVRKRFKHSLELPGSGATYCLSWLIQ